jgi:hypothetical protein
MWLDVCKQFELLGFDCESLGLESRVNEGVRNSMTVYM